MSAKEWADIVVAAAAVAALVVSLISLRLSWRALRLSEEQERRREPRLVPRLLESHFEDLPTGERVYSFRFSVANPTDSDNAVAQIEMHLGYVVGDSTTVAVKLPPIAPNHESNGKLPRLVTPCRIAAHDAVSGWCDFGVKPGILSGRRIDGYRIVFTDSHQVETAVEAFVISEKRNAT